jgi:hypothetical protein
LKQTTVQNNTRKIAAVILPANRAGQLGATGVRDSWQADAARSGPADNVNKNIINIGQGYGQDGLQHRLQRNCHLLSQQFATANIVWCHQTKAVRRQTHQPT